ncbi:MAG: hypothetical protein R3C53_27265 [Pirellulaceae bacterium]
MSFAKPIMFLFACAVSPMLAGAADAVQSGAPIQGASRLATFQDAGHQYFALSVQPDEKANFPQASSYDVVVLFDTSATQTGLVRIEALEVLDELAATLPAGARASLMACDVETVDLSSGLLPTTDPKWDAAVARLKKRIPLGATDLGTALRTAAKQLSNTSGQRTIIYIGDGINRSHYLTSDEHRQLVNELVKSQISVSSLAIGPVVDVANLAALANHTGGIVLSRAAIEESTQAIGRSLGLSAAMPVVWVNQVKLPPALASYFPNQFPPLRIDRDSVIFGEISGGLPASAPIAMSGSVAGKAVELSWSVEPEASNPDMGFLAAVVDNAKRDGGLNSPALGSAGLRAMSFILAEGAHSMVKSGQFALKAGQVESAIQIAEAALKSDPNNAEALSLLKAAKDVASSPAASVPAGKFMQTGGDPFADPFADPAPATPAQTEPAPANPFGDDPEPVPAGPAADSPFGAQPAAPAVVNDNPVVPSLGVAPAPAPMSVPFSSSSDLSELNAGDLLAEEQALRQARAEAFAASVREAVRSAHSTAQQDPTGVKNSLKLLLEEIDSVVDIDAALRAQLRDQVGSAIQVVAKQEAAYFDRVERAETLRTRANAAERLLAETNRRDESLKQLVEQFNFMMAQQRYLEAAQDIAPEIGDLAPDTALENVTREESSLLANYAAVKEAFERREQGFVDVMQAVRKAAGTICWGSTCGLSATRGLASADCTTP